MPKLTVKQAAAALGCSTRTLRRRIAEGELSAAKERRGTIDVTVLDPAELARFAEAQGQTLVITDGKERQPLIGGCDTQGQSPSIAAVATETNEGIWGSKDGNHRQTGVLAYDTGRQMPSPVTGTAAAPMANDQGQIRVLQEQVGALREERDFLRRVLDNVTKALPPGNTGAEEADRWRDYAEELERWQGLGWWQRRRQRRPEPPRHKRRDMLQ
jgi:excisionase family DNA binding protein